jgi:putative ABC transport system permease protein
MRLLERALYRLLLLAFPRRVRREFGHEMEEMFRDHLADTRQRGGSRLVLWVSAGVDAVKFGLADRFTPLRMRKRERGSGASASDELGGVQGASPFKIRWRFWVQAFRQDVRYALRLLVKQPGISIVAILTLALGIGANTAIFSAVNAVLLRPLPYPGADRLVMVWEKRHTEGVLDNVVSPADFLDWSKMHRSFSAIAGMTAITADLTGSGEPVRLFAGAVSPPFFDVLGVTPALGRTFRAEEATVGQHRVVILGHRIWQDRFGSDPSVVGRKIQLNAVPHEVVGVLPESFEFPDATIELWAPLAFGGTPRPPSRTNHFLSVYARMKDGVTLQQARTDMDQVAAQLTAQYPDANRNHGAHVAMLRDELQAPVKEGLLTLLAAVGFVLLIACVNVANLLLARAASRRREMAVRAAVGAARWRLAGQALTESVVLALLGGAAGLLVAYWGIELLRQITPRGVPVLGVDQVRLNPSVLTFTLLLSIVTGLVFGILPAWQLASQDVNESLKEGGRSAAGIRKRLRMALVVSEIALASLLLVGAGLTLRSFQTVLRAEAGFTQDRLLTAFVSLPAARYRDDAQRVAAYDEIERRFASLPGVGAVGGTSHLPLSGQDSRSGVAIEGREPVPDAPTRAHPRAVTLDYFKAMGIRLVAGRHFAASDHSESPFVVIVNETMARRYWPGNSPLGKRVRMGGTTVPREVVGIVRDVKHWGFDRPVNPEMYLPQKQMVWDGLTFVLATDVDPVTLTAAVRSELKAVDPDLPLSNVRTMDDVASRSVAARRSTMLLLGIFGALALVLAAAGIYAVMAQLVVMRSPEIGVRMTLGAQPATVMRLVLKEGLIQAVAGLAIGLAGAVMVMRGFRTVLFQVSPADPLTLAAVAVLLLGTATLACIVPARRAMQVDPVQTLRN